MSTAATLAFGPQGPTSEISSNPTSRGVSAAGTAERLGRPAPRRAVPRDDQRAGRIQREPARAQQRGGLRRSSAVAREGDAEATRMMAAYRDSRDPVDFDALYRATCEDVQAWILSLLRGGSAHLDARELLQETFINVFRYPGSFRDETDSSYRVWVRTIAGNVLRRARANSAGCPERELSDGSYDLPDSASGPAEQSQLAESAARMQQTWQLFLGLYLNAWGDLADRDQRALVLAEAEELPYAEVGARLGVRPSNVKMIVFRARRRLAARMARVFEEGSPIEEQQRIAGVDPGVALEDLGPTRTEKVAEPRHATATGAVPVRSRASQRRPRVAA